MTKLLEPSEEVRLEYCKILKVLITLDSEEEEILIPFINFVVDIDRALIMDPYREI